MFFMIVVYYNNRDVVDLLMSCGVKINVRYKIGKMVFYFVFLKGNFVCINFFVEKGVDVNVIDYNGNIVMYCCC